MAKMILEVQPGCSESLAAIALLDGAGEEFQLEFQLTEKKSCFPRLRRADQSITGFAAMARRGLGKESYYQGTPEQRASVDQWLDTVYGDIRPLVMALWQKDNGAASDELVTYLSTLEKHVNAEKFLCGRETTAADIALLFEILPALRFFLGSARLNKIPKFISYIHALVALPQLGALTGPVEFSPQPLEIAAPKVTEKKAVSKVPAGEKKKPATADNDEDAEEPKKEYIFPETTFNFYDFKTLYVNAKNKHEALDFLWKNWDAKAFSFWYVRYDKLPGECQKLFLTKNLMTGFLTRADQCRKYALAVQGVYGEEPDFETCGVWLWRGTEILEPLKEHSQFEVYQFKKLNIEDSKDKALIEEYWCKLDDDAVVDGRKLQAITLFK